jgi:hypothetical protein
MIGLRSRRLARRIPAAVPCVAAAAAAMLGAPPAAAFERDEAPRSPALVPIPQRYWHAMATLAVGDSLRFNNPYRLSNQLGDTGESLSRTPVYGVLGGAVALGDPDGWQHGASLQWSRALSGLPQHVIAPGYMLVQGRWRPWIAWARAALPIVVNPDPSLGGEAALGGAYLVLAGVGVHAELVGDVFYGAATWTTGKTTIPMLSLQAGVVVDYEVLP